MRPETTPRVVRPLTGPLRIYLPPEAASILRAALSPRVRVQRREGHFLVSRGHVLRVVAGLTHHYGDVIVQIFGSHKQQCAAACWEANPRTSYECECRCAGTNHGTGKPLGHVIAHNEHVGAISVEHSATLSEWRSQATARGAIVSYQVGALRLVATETAPKRLPPRQAQAPAWPGSSLTRDQTDATVERMITARRELRGLDA